MGNEHVCKLTTNKKKEINFAKRIEGVTSIIFGSVIFDFEEESI